MSKIKTYNSEDFRKEYFNKSPKLDKLFKKSVEDFFCLKIEDLTKKVLKPITPSREESHTIIFVTKGSFKTKIGFKEYIITPNNIVILQAGAVFSTEQVSKNVKGFTCHFHPNILIGKFGNRSLVSDFQFLNNGNYPIININKQSRSEIINILERLVTEFKSNTKPNSDIIHSYIYTLLTELKILYGLSNFQPQNASFQITSRFRMLANQKVKENLKVADFARMMNISPNHLNKSVKVSTLKSASEILEEIKLIEVKYLLYQSTLSISEISYEMGYLDPSYFTRFFKKREKISPTEFRKMIEKS
ncbi:MAG: helix-turn-helix domain-containing protein [Cellulophaga sp.]|uniref:helix-turn-helix domain-containing protein n=1 Tax=unclassified Cellulophaga TaxID=2634405 RepID=UPI000C2B95EE|nr:MULTISPECIES: AraC family transcriptional regulator [unclassified Cellulophaga]MDO6492898.1 AraC family transcriptional regulator [Cellulophaga sp. 2_MG-2023]MDO6496400.1 AraC family transcriptional regulator [Cellulophaga sp. 3_MG-2023]PKB43035.1 AraC-like DNA-binding protein [Cellulophaga sp. RHA19]